MGEERAGKEREVIRQNKKGRERRQRKREEDGKGWKLNCKERRRGGVRVGKENSGEDAGGRGCAMRAERREGSRKR